MKFEIDMCKNEGKVGYEISKTVRLVKAPLQIPFSGSLPPNLPPGAPPLDLVVGI